MAHVIRMPGEQKLLAVMIWLLWNNRNQWLWNHEKEDATQLGVHAFHIG
jgi:hypothetical protein